MRGTTFVVLVCTIVSTGFAAETAGIEGAQDRMAVAVSTAPIEVSTRAITQALPAEPETPIAPLAFSVTPLESIVDYHQKEIISLQAWIKRANDSANVILERRKAMEKEITDKKQKISDLEKENSKSAKRESARLTKEISRINKDLQVVAKDLKVQARDLANEARQNSTQSQQTLRLTYQEAIKAIQATAN